MKNFTFQMAYGTGWQMPDDEEVVAYNSALVGWMMEAQLREPIAEFNRLNVDVAELEIERETHTIMNQQFLFGPFLSMTLYGVKEFGQRRRAFGYLLPTRDHAKDGLFCRGGGTYNSQEGLGWYRGADGTLWELVAQFARGKGVRIKWPNGVTVEGNTSD